MQYCALEECFVTGIAATICLSAVSWSMRCVKQSDCRWSSNDATGGNGTASGTAGDSGDSGFSENTGAEGKTTAACVMLRFTTVRNHSGVRSVAIIDSYSQHGTMLQSTLTVYCLSIQGLEPSGLRRYRKCCSSTLNAMKTPHTACPLASFVSKVFLGLRTGFQYVPPVDYCWQ